MQLTQEPMQRVAAYSLYAWDHTYPATRLVAPWQQAGIELLHGTHWDQIFPEQVAASELVVLHRDFPRLSKAYQQVIQQARHLGKPVFFDLDDLLFELPPDHPDRRYHYISDALFPILQAIVDADAVTVSTPVLRDAVLSLNPNTLLLPTFLDERLWPIKRVEPREKPKPLTIGWIHDQQLADGTGDFTAGLRQFLRQEGNAVQPLPMWIGSRIFHSATHNSPLVSPGSPLIWLSSRIAVELIMAARARCAISSSVHAGYRAFLARYPHIKMSSLIYAMAVWHPMPVNGMLPWKLWRLRPIYVVRSRHPPKATSSKAGCCHRTPTAGWKRWTTRSI
jgi:hypothetical protein